MVKLISKKHIKNEDVFDISVKNNHNFFANGILVHNCGEQTLAPGGVCNLASLNVSEMINENGTDFDYDKIKKYASYMVRFLDDVNDYSNAPLEEYKYNMTHKRRIGCGIVGWGSALYKLRVPFASKKANGLRETLMKTFSHTVYKTSIELAKEKGMFAECEPVLHAESDFLKQIELPEEDLTDISTYGIRNAALLSMQPNGNCVTIDSIVKTKDGDKTIEQLLYNEVNISSLKEGDVVKLNKPLNINTFEGEDVIEQIYVNGDKPTIKITTNKATLTNTYNHKYLVKENDDAKWVEAKDLSVGMKLIKMK